MKMLVESEYSVRQVCNMANITPQAYYKRIKKTVKNSIIYTKMEDFVKSNRSLKSRVGLRTIHYKENLSSLLGINKFEVEMSARGYALKPYKSFIKTTDSRGFHHKYENKIEGTEVRSPNVTIVGDITYYQCDAGLFYIFLFTDLYTLEVKAAYGSVHMKGVIAEKCLRQVMVYVGKKKFHHSLIIHTDGGGQYRSDKYQYLLRLAEIIPSQSKSCFENGLAERMNGIIKNEYLNDYNIKGELHLNRVLKRIVKQHNEVWPSSKLGWRTPLEFAKWVITLPEKDRPVVKVKKLN